MPKPVKERGLIKPDQAELARILRVLRTQGKTVAVADGVFDVLHAGHVRALEDASSRAHYLVVVVHSDTAVRERFGDGRPVRDQQDRAETLAALKGVHYVTYADGEDLSETLRTLRPDILLRGNNRKENEAERKALAAVGCSRITMGDKPVRSTSRLIERIRNRESSGAKKRVAKSGAKAKPGAKRETAKATSTARGGATKTAGKAAKKVPSKTVATKKTTGKGRAKAAASKKPARKKATAKAATSRKTTTRGKNATAAKKSVTGSRKKASAARR